MQGVYKIKNIKTNLVYIGSSIHIERRWKEHQYRLQNNAHHSYKLQNSYNRSKDKSIFHYEVIEEVQDASKLKEREQYWIDYYDLLMDIIAYEVIILNTQKKRKLQDDYT